MPAKRRIPALALALASALALALLSAWPARAADKLKIGVLPGVYADAIEAAVPEAKAQGIDVQVIEFTDWTTPNVATDSGDIDINFFQHQPFLDTAIQKNGFKLAGAGVSFVANIGLYSLKHKTLAEIPQGGKVGIASDPVNQGSGLLLLQKAGIIALRTGQEPGASVNDVAGNPKHLRFVEVDVVQLLRALDDVDLGIAFPSYFVNAGKTAQASQATLYSGVSDTLYAMGFVARTDRARDPKILRFIRIYQNSPKVREVIAVDFNHDPKLYTLPWKH